MTNYELTACSQAGHETAVSYNAATFYDRDGKLQPLGEATRQLALAVAHRLALMLANIHLRESLPWQSMRHHIQGETHEDYSAS